MKLLASRTNGFKDSIFAVMSQKAAEHNALNLSQGFPDFDGPEFLKNKANDYIAKGYNQYAPYMGIPALREAVSSYYKKFYDLNYNAANMVTICNGATEGIYLTIQSLINPGDEVIVLEPFYDSYITSIQMAGGAAVPVTLKGTYFEFSLEDLEAAVSDKTKLIIVNNPHNPSGKVFSIEEQKALCEFTIRHDLYLMSDEVYEFLLFDEAKHIPFASYPGMFERTITLSSAGKTFGLTGWKIGWVCAGPGITDIVRKVHQYITFSVATPLQYAVADALGELDWYLPEFVNTYKQKRDLFYSGLKSLGFDFPIPKGTYFMMLPLDQITEKDDVSFCEELIEKFKVATIPPSAFYLKSDEGKKYLRLCFAKKDETLKQVLKNLEGLKSYFR